MSDAARTQLAFSPEVSYNEVPAAPIMQALRFTGESLNSKNATVVSSEIRSDRSRSDLLLVGTDVEGSVDAELSYGTYGTLMEAALGGTWTTNVLKNGIVNRSFLFEKGFLDVGQFVQLRGCVVDAMDIDLSARAISKISFGFKGAQATISAASVAGTLTAATTATPITSGAKITGMELNTNWAGLKVKSFKLSVKNNLRSREEVQSNATSDPGRGVQDVTATAEIYFTNAAVYNQFLANSSVAFTVNVGDADTAAKYIIFMPKVKVTAADQQVGGVDTDVMQTVSLRALYDATTGAHIRITRG